MYNLKNKTVLVTGGTGFVGSHVVEELVLSGVSVVTTFLQHNPRSYFMTQGLNQKVVMEYVDLVNFDRVFDLVTKHEVDFIFHLAAQPLVDVAYQNPRRTLESNINGTINLLESMRLYSNIAGIVVASSDKAYGKHGEIKYTEDHQLKGDHPYEVSKSATDLICTSYAKTYGLPIIITRFGNIYGEGDLNFARLIPGIMKALIQKEKLEIRSDGSFVRDYLYVKDVVTGYLLLASQINKARGHAYNFGSPDTLKVIDVITRAENFLAMKIPHKILNIAKNEIPYQSLDYSKIKKNFGWEPSHTFESTIYQIYAWYKSHFSL